MLIDRIAVKRDERTRVPAAQQMVVGTAAPNLLSDTVDFSTPYWSIVRATLREPIVAPTGHIAHKLAEDGTLDTQRHPPRRGLHRGWWPPGGQLCRQALRTIRRASLARTARPFEASANDLRSQARGGLVRGYRPRVATSSAGNDQIARRLVVVLADGRAAGRCTARNDVGHGRTGWTDRLQGRWKIGSVGGRSAKSNQGSVATLEMANAGRPSAADGGDAVAKLGKEFARYYEDYPRRRSRLGFHSDYYLSRLMFHLLDQAETFIETGTSSGDSIVYVARNYPEYPCYSCDAKEQNIISSARRVAAGSHTNVELHVRRSPDFLSMTW